MGAAGSVRRAAKEEVHQLHEKVLNREVDAQDLSIAYSEYSVYH